ncbi:MAG: hypothetical protein H8K09_06000 [Nitrospira sp.]|jgi:hypothetical protein|nr:hypothetical protein [Nitrospira sp.]
MATPPIATPDVSSTWSPREQRYSLLQRCRSLYHGLWFRLSEWIRWSRRPYHETPIGCLSGLASWQITRIDELREHYQVCFESHYGQHTALANYAYLDLLDRASTIAKQPIPQGIAVTDVGCANFWYARALQAFFRPATLTGVDVEGFRLYPTGYSRYDAARGYIVQLPHTSFVVANYCEMESRADVITAWYPFVTPSPVLAWRLPLRVFSPERLFERIARNLTAHGLFFMVNQGIEEAAIAATYCRRAGLRFIDQWVHSQPLRARPHPPVASWWTT